MGTYIRSHTHSFCMLRVALILAAAVAVASVPVGHIRAWATAPEGGSTWALLVAGSNTYSNYRHQSDICHAYQILKGHGIPDSNIVVMMYDDIADNRRNPTKGVIINEPEGKPNAGKNVYDGVPKDYTGKSVTAANMMSILSGDADAMKGIQSGKVIASGPNDNVFVYFADHGAEGLVAFPEFGLFHPNPVSVTHRHILHAFIAVDVAVQGVTL